MILELADFRIAADQSDAFDAAITLAVTTVASKSVGFRGYSVNKCIETPGRYVLMLYWDTVENHMVDFREGPLFVQWRAIVGPFFTAPPVVEHFSIVATSAT